MKFSEISTRLTGVSTPFGGISWQPNEPEVAVARRVITFLEDRRVLYAPDTLEVPQHCVESVLKIRAFLTGEIGNLKSGSKFGDSLRAMRAACRKFLDRVGNDGQDVVIYANHHGHWASWTFYSALGEMRGTFGVLLAQIAVTFRLDVEDKLATIIPENADKDSIDEPRAIRRQLRKKP